MTEGLLKDWSSANEDLSPSSSVLLRSDLFAGMPWVRAAELRATSCDISTPVPHS